MAKAAKDSYLFKSGDVFLVGQRTARIDRTQAERTQCDLLVRPMNQILRYSVSPMHWTPLCVVWVVLIELWKMSREVS